MAITVICYDVNFGTTVPLAPDLVEVEVYSLRGYVFSFSEDVLMDQFHMSKRSPLGVLASPRQGHQESFAVLPVDDGFVSADPQDTGACILNMF